MSTKRRKRLLFVKKNGMGKWVLYGDGGFDISAIDMRNPKEKQKGKKKKGS